jgi:hypothetical protein
MIYVIKTSYSSHPDFKRFLAGRRYRKLHKTTEKLISALKKLGYKIICPSDSAFDKGSYDDVYRSIESCGCTLAFTDSLTFAETRRATELTHSIMVAKIPVYLYTSLDDFYNQNALFKGLIDLPNVDLLPSDVKSAVSILTNLTKGN